MTHHSYIGWVHVSGAWALCMLHFRVCRKFVCCSCVYHGLEARLCVLLFILDLLWRESISWSFILYGLLYLRVGPCLIMGFSLLNPLFAHSVELLIPLCYSYNGVIWSVLAGPLLGLMYAFLHLITMTQYFHWAYIYATLGLLDPFHCLRASLAHFFLLGHPRPIFFPWASLAPSNSAFPWAFANSFGLPRPNYHILYFWGS